MQDTLLTQLERLAVLADKAFTPQLILAMLLLFALLALLLGARVFVLYRDARRVQRRFSETLMAASKGLATHWQAYSMTFINDLNGDYKTTWDAADFFDPERLTAEWLDLRWWHFVPNVFFLLGMVAVLLHLFYGLVLFDVTSHEAVMESIKTTLFIVANGFLVLLSGVALSLAMHFLVRYLVASLRGEMKRLVASLNSRFRISALQERELHLADYAKTLTRVVNTLFAGSPRAKAMTPGVLSRALLEETMRHNQEISAFLDASGVAVLPRERLEDLAAAMGRAVAHSIAPGLERLTAAVERLEAAGQGHADAPTSAEVVGRLAAMQQSLERLVLHLETEAGQKAPPELEELATVMLDTANRLQQCLRSLQVGRSSQTKTLGKAQGPRQ
jgi:hypothetical protein